MNAVDADLLVDDGPALRLVVGHVAGPDAVLSAALSRYSIHPGLKNSDISFRNQGFFCILRKKNSSFKLFKKEVNASIDKKSVSVYIELIIVVNDLFMRYFCSDKPSARRYIF